MIGVTCKITLLKYHIVFVPSITNVQVSIIREGVAIIDNYTERMTDVQSCIICVCISVI